MSLIGLTGATGLGGFAQKLDLKEGATITGRYEKVSVTDEESAAHLNFSHELDTTSRFQYNMDYFSGAQANIYIGPILLDEVTTLQWNVNQSKVPLYGYASQHFDEMARGAVLIQGQFSINYVEPNYLFSVLWAIKKKKATTGAQEQDMIIRERMHAAMNSGEIREQVKQNSFEKWDYVRRVEKRENTRTFFRHINDAIWGPSREGKHQTDFGRVDDTNVNGFDININFQTEDSSRPQTKQIIQNVHILGSSRSIIIDEQPVQEVYSFYARKMSGPIG